MLQPPVAQAAPLAGLDPLQSGKPADTVGPSGYPLGRVLELSIMTSSSLRQTAAVGPLISNVVKVAESEMTAEFS